MTADDTAAAALVAQVPPCFRCGGAQVVNERHDPANPDTGYAFACIPCLVWQRNHAQQTVRKISGLIDQHHERRRDADAGLEPKRREAFLRSERACVRCLAGGQSGDEWEVSGLCQRCLNGPLPGSSECGFSWEVESAWNRGAVFCSEPRGHAGVHRGTFDGDVWRSSAPTQAAASLPVLPCGCVPPCEGGHE